MAHYLVDQFNKHQRKGPSSLKAKNEPPPDHVDRGVGNTEGRGRGALEDPKIGQPEKRYVCVRWLCHRLEAGTIQSISTPKLV
jgi:hypothetical protein